MGDTLATDFDERTLQSELDQKMSSIVNGLIAEPSPVPILYHYTSQAAAQSILEKKCFWATDMFYLNDKQELEYPIKLVCSILDEKIAKSDNEDLSLIFRRLRDAMGEGSSFLRIYGISFSERADDLSQWRGYGAGSGVALGFCLNGCSRRFRLLKVDYSRPSQCALLRTVIEQYVEHCQQLIAQASPPQRESIRHLMIQAFCSRILEMLLRFKAPFWESETEWRVVEVGFPFDYNNRDINFRQGAVGLTPYLEINLDDDDSPYLWSMSLRELFLGPSVSTDMSEYAWKLFLRRNNYHECQVIRSLVPLR